MKSLDNGEKIVRCPFKTRMPTSAMNARRVQKTSVNSVRKMKKRPVTSMLQRPSYNNYIEETES